MNRSMGILIATALILGGAGLSGCGKKDGDGATNIVEMNASDGTMNDMTVVESATLDRAGSEVANGLEAEDAGNASNAM